MSVLFATAHKPTAAQITELGGDITMLSDHDPVLFEQLIQCPSSADQLDELVEKLCEAFIGKFEKVVLPVGSPAFQHLLGRRIGTLMNHPVLIPDLLFSHSERDSVEVDGVKRSVFNHQHFITV